jgi:DNA-binding PadR family transcriptional regulator
LALSKAALEWRHGYDLAQATGLRSGTLYPLLIRLEAKGLLEAEWQPPVARGRPPRHAYRLTAKGLALARDLQSAIRSDAAEPPVKRGELFS